LWLDTTSLNAAKGRIKTLAHKWPMQNKNPANSIRSSNQLIVVIIQKLWDAHRIGLPTGMPKHLWLEPGQFSPSVDSTTCYSSGVMLRRLHTWPKFTFCYWTTLQVRKITWYPSKSIRQVALYAKF